METQSWKRRSAILQLKLDSQEEDGLHLLQFQAVLTTELQHKQQALRDQESQHKAVLVGIEWPAGLQKHGYCSLMN